MLQLLAPTLQLTIKSSETIPIDYNSAHGRSFRLVQKCDCCGSPPRLRSDAYQPSGSDCRRQRSTGLVDLVQKVRSCPYAVTDQDLDALRNRCTKDQLFEIIVAAAFGAANDQIAAAHRALEDA